MYATESKPFWIEFDKIFSISNNHHSAVYAFAISDKIPDQTTWPFNLKETFYVGMSGGLDNLFLVDRKKKDNPKSARAETRFHKRMKEHSYEFKNKKKTKEVLDLFDCMDKKIYACVIVPPIHLKPQSVRSWISLVESEQIHMYLNLFGELPIMNLAERSDVSDSLKKKDSFSYIEGNKLKENNLLSFME